LDAEVNHCDGSHSKVNPLKMKVVVNKGNRGGKENLEILYIRENKESILLEYVRNLTPHIGRIIYFHVIKVNINKA